MQLFNTLTRRVEPLALPVAGQPFTFYSCGPTVYDFAHIGNLKTFIVYDIVKRVLIYMGYEVRHVMNLTDVEDKIIAAAGAANRPIGEFTAPMVAAFFADLNVVGCLPLDAAPRATEFIPQQIALIQLLISKGCAYEREGSVYFRLAAFADYGKLARLDVNEIQDGARTLSDEYEKDSPRDFVLWKAARETEHPSAVWKSPWGPGRPGWHLECSAMAHELLIQPCGGRPIDLHAGGVDLVFPHHTNEIAQSEAAWPDVKPFVRHWLHAEHLMVDGGKMSKSLGNFYTWRDLAAKDADPMALRLFLAAAHYRKPLNFTYAALGATTAALERLRDFDRRLAEFPAAEAQVPAELTTARLAFKTALADDLNLPEALAAVFGLLTTAHKALDQNNWGAPEATALREFLRHDFEAVFGVNLEPCAVEIPAEIQGWFEQRQAARKAKDFKAADDLRGRIEAAGYLIEDGKEGARLKKKV